MEEMLSYLDSPELWKSVAFVIVVFLTIAPFYRYVLKKTKERADKISAHIEEALKLRREAEILLKEAGSKDFHKDEKRKEITLKAMKEARILKEEALEQRQKRLSEKETEISDRVKLIKESGLKELKEQVISIALGTTMDVIQKDEALFENKAFFDAALKEVGEVLSHKEDIKKILTQEEG